MTGPRADAVARDLSDRLPGLLAEADPAVLGRTVLALAAMHEAARDGRCRYCRPHQRRWWRWRGSADPCPTRRVLAAELLTSPPASRWTSA
ncbi:MAG TPA: hypothetical protein VFX70_04700 [Mycobacteriales bacterium]|nr:hypothetical protein [Mycobacteriales bacterium]